MKKDEFLNYVIVGTDTECWPWTGSTNGRRYGRLEFEGKYQQAHRVSYQIFREAIPDNTNVLHECDNPICVNPKHLFLGTQQDNVDDMIAKGRACFGDQRPIVGSQHPSAQLDEDKVREIKRLLNEGHRHRDIANYFGVARQTITNISTGTRWSHV